MSEVTYISLPVTIKVIRPKAVKVACEGEEEWVSRSLFHSSTDRDFDGAEPGEELEVKLMDWKVRELGW